MRIAVKSSEKLIAKEFAAPIEVAMDQSRRLGFLGALTHVLPGAQQILGVDTQILFAGAHTRGAHDETAGRRTFVRVNLLQISFRRRARSLSESIFARNAEMLDRRHVNQKPARQSDVRSNARAFLGDRLFGNLHQNLLAFAQEIGDGRLCAIVSRRPAPVRRAGG